MKLLVLILLQPPLMEIKKVLKSLKLKERRSEEKAEMMEDLRDCDKRVLGLGLAEEETRR